MTAASSSLIFALWIAWLIYWGLAALRTRVARRRESRLSRALDIVLLGLGGVFLASPRAIGGWLSGLVLPRSEGEFWVGVGLILLGLAATVWARQYLGAYWSAVVALKEHHQLIQTGPYRWVRHPIYGGLLLAVVGSAIALDEWRGFLGVAFFLAAFLRRMAIEESWLAEAFPEEYARYRSEVAALIPFVY